MPRPYPAAPRAAHRPESMPRPYPAAPRAAHRAEAMPRPDPAGVAHTRVLAALSTNMRTSYADLAHGQ